MNHVFGELGILSAGKGFLPEDCITSLGRFFWEVDIVQSIMTFGKWKILPIFCWTTSWYRVMYRSYEGVSKVSQHPPTQQQTARIPNLNCSSANPGNELMGFSLLNPNAALIFGGHGIQVSWAGTKLELSTGICINIHILYIHTELDHPQRQKNYWNQTLDILCFSMIHTDILRTKKNTVDCENTYILIMRSIIHP